LKLIKPTVLDIPAMQQLVAPEIKSGVILNRSDDELAANIRSYVLIKESESILGYAALHIHSPKLAEIRSLIVDSNHRGKSIGTKIVHYLLKEARILGLQEVLSLTYESKFFEKLNFIEIPKESLPEHKIWADCIKCIHFPICNEISMIYKITQES